MGNISALAKRHIITDGGFYRAILSIAFPIALQNLIVFGVSVTDTIFLGQLGEVQLAACAQANQPQFIYNLLTFGLAGGGSVLASQYWGKRDIESVRRVIGIVLRVAIVAALLFMGVVLLLPEQIMRFYLKDEAVIAEAVRYLRIVAWGYFFFGVSNTFICIIRSVELVKVSVVVSSVSFMVNVVLNYILIFGHFGAPAMGIEGAAWGTFAARLTEFIMIFIYALFIDKKLGFRLKNLFRGDKQLTKDYTRYSIPVVLNELAWGVGISVQAAILGNLSTEILSANSISSVLQQLATVTIFGLANAACVTVGKRIGEGDLPRARKSATTFMFWSVVLGLVAMALMFLLRRQFVGMYNVTDSTRLLTENLLIVTAVNVLFVSVSSTSIVGVLRGAGDTNFCMKLEMIALWVVAVPLGAIAGFVLKAPALLTFICLRVDEPIKAVIATIRTTRASTYRNVTRGETPKNSSDIDVVKTEEKEVISDTNSL